MNVPRKIMPGHLPSLPRLPTDALRKLRGVASAATTAAVSSRLLLTGSKNNTTAAAEELARETGRELVRIDLSAVISQYSEETEKNLDRIFATVDPARSILFFDEVDALFSKRTGVEDGHDRFAGVELSWLLQRIESFPTLTIFARRHSDDIPAGCKFRNDIRLPK